LNRTDTLINFQSLYRAIGRAIGHYSLGIKRLTGIKLVDLHAEAGFPSGFKVVASLKPLIKANPTVTDLQDLLAVLRRLPEQDDSFHSVFFFDEANALNALEKKGGEDKAALETLLQWMVGGVKEGPTKNRVHIFMSSSDSFFCNWLNHKLGGMVHTVNPIVIGDLNLKEAEEFYDKRCAKLKITKFLDFKTEIYPYLGISKIDLYLMS
jgi:hypothetical protein